MRPVRVIAAVMFAAAIAVAGCAAHSTAIDPSVTPVNGPAPVPVPVPEPVPVPVPNPAPKPPVLADGHYDAYVRQVDSGRDRLVVDLVQVFHDQAAVNEAIADGQSRDAAQLLSTYVRNKNPRLRTLTLAGNVRELLGGDCEAPLKPRDQRAGCPRPLRCQQLLLRADRRWRGRAADPGAANRQRLLSSRQGGRGPPSGGAGRRPAPRLCAGGCARCRTRGRAGPPGRRGSCRPAGPLPVFACNLGSG